MDSGTGDLRRATSYLITTATVGHFTVNGAHHYTEGAARELPHPSVRLGVLRMHHVCLVLLTLAIFRGGT